MSARVLLIDHIDSFTFNLVQALRALDAEVFVRRADELNPAELEDLRPTHLVLSPGPGRPEPLEQTRAVLLQFRERIPVLGVCLGHQCLGHSAGAEIVHATDPRHGETVRVYHDGRGPFAGLANPFEAGRYHSLVVKEEGLAPEFEISAWSSDGEVLGLRHRNLPLHGLQFHPESVLTPMGSRILASFLALAPASGSSGSTSAAEATELSA